MTDEQILAGFASLHQAIALGFERVDRELAGIRADIRSLDLRLTVVEQRLGALEERVTVLEQRMGDLDHRMMRRFDIVDERLAQHDRRLLALEKYLLAS